MAVNPRRDGRHRLIWFPDSPSSVSLSLGARMVKDIAERPCQLRLVFVRNPAMSRSSGGRVYGSGPSVGTIVFFAVF